MSATNVAAPAHRAGKVKPGAVALTIVTWVIVLLFFFRWPG